MRKVHFKNTVRVEYVSNYDKKSEVRVFYYQKKSDFKILFDSLNFKYAGEYGKLTMNQKLQICRQVNTFKNTEMMVHPKSQLNTHFLDFYNIHWNQVKYIKKK